MLHHNTVRTMLPIMIEPRPSALGRLAHLQTVDNHIIRTISGRFPLTHIPTHSDIKQHCPILDRPRARRHQVLHDGASVNVPHKSSAARRFPIAPYGGPATLPDEIIADRPMRHIGDARAAH